MERIASGDSRNRKPFDSPASAQIEVSTATSTRHGSIHNAQRSTSAIVWGLLGLLLLTGAWLRLAGLDTYQHFLGDQGRDYLVVIEWWEHGTWPLLGPLRITGDYTIGPGYYYTVAPLMVLSGFRCWAGAATMALLALLTYAALFLWIVRTTGNRWAALLIVFLLTFSYELVLADRVLWNAHLPVVGFVILAWLLELEIDKPLVSLTAAASIALLLPQWHTTGLLIVVGFFPFFAYRTWQQRAVLRKAPFTRWAISLLVILAILLVLYLPPVLHEFRAEQGNLEPWLIHTLSAGEGADGKAQGLVHCLHVYWKNSLQYAFGLLAAYPGFQWTMLVLVLSGTALAAITSRGRVPLSIPALVLVVLLFMLATAGRENVHDYFFHGILPMPVMLIGWAAGRGWPAVGNPPRKWKQQARIGIFGLGAGILLVTGLWNAKASFRIPSGQFWFGKRMKWTEEIAKTIIKDADGKSITVAQRMPGNSQADLLYFLHLHGARLKIREMYRTDFRTEDLGDLLYLVLRQEAVNWTLDLAGEELDVEDLGQQHDARIYRIRKPELGEDVERFGFERDGARIVIVKQLRR